MCQRLQRLGFNGNGRPPARHESRVPTAGFSSPRATLISELELFKYASFLSSLFPIFALMLLRANHCAHEQRCSMKSWSCKTRSSDLKDKQMHYEF